MTIIPFKHFVLILLTSYFFLKIAVNIMKLNRAHTTHKGFFLQEKKESKKERQHSECFTVAAKMF